MAAVGRRATLPVVSCPTSFGVEGIPEAWNAQQLPTQVTRKSSARLAFYSNGRGTVLGPKGWTCSAGYGANGGGGMSVYALGKSGDLSDSDTQGVSVMLDYTGHGPGADLVCGYFPGSPAAQFYGPEGPPCSPIPDGRETRFTTADLVEFRDPDGSVGAVIYPQVGNEPAGGVSVALVECQLHGKRRSLCGPIIDDFLVRNAPVIPPPIEPNPAPPADECCDETNS